jgi:hypothetical protein
MTEAFNNSTQFMSDEDLSGHRPVSEVVTG